MGNFYQTFDDDSIILNYLFDYQIKDKRIGFPVQTISKVVNKLNDSNINYFVDNKYYSFDDNQYLQILDKSKEIYLLKENIKDINNYLTNNIERKYIKRIIDKINEVIDNG